MNILVGRFRGKQLKYHKDGEKMLDFNKFVEGHLTGIKVYQEENRAELFLQETTGRKWVLNATDVSELMILQMRMQNIIFRIVIWDLNSNEEEYKGKIFSLIHGKFETGKDHLSSPVINAKIDMIRRGEAVLLELEPVYGALVLIIAKQVLLDSE
ncbi:MAG: hypothetical protein V4754_03850 [Pseudomonadota bacterium]